MKTFLEFLNESKTNHPHLIKNANMTFSDIRATLNNLFTCNFSICNSLTEDENELNKMKEISEETKIALKEALSPKQALTELMETLDKLASNVGYKATINDYIHDQFAKKIVKCAGEHGLDVNKKSLFVSELADRLNLSGFKHKPSKSDLATFAKREGMSPSDEKYRKFIVALDETCDIANSEIVHPVEEMLVNCAVLLSKVLQVPACLDESKESCKFCKQCSDFYKDYTNKKLEINDNSVGDVREFLTNIRDYVNHAKAMNKLTFKLGNKMYSLKSTLPNVEFFTDIIDF